MRGAAPRDVGGCVKPEDVAGDEGPGWRVLFVDLAKMVVFVSFLALLWAGSAHLFACGEQAWSARGLIREVRDAPMNDAGMPWVMPLLLG